MSDERANQIVKQAEAIDAKVRLKYVGQIRELTERAEAAEARADHGAAEIAQLRQDLAQAKSRDVLTAPMAAGLLLQLKAECETQHDRAEKAEAELQQWRDAQARLLTLDRIHFCGDVYVRVADLDAAVKGG